MCYVLHVTPQAALSVAITLYAECKHTQTLTGTSNSLEIRLATDHTEPELRAFHFALMSNTYQIRSNLMWKINSGL